MVEPLAEGGMGTVFIAEHLKLCKMVALKTSGPPIVKVCVSVPPQLAAALDKLLAPQPKDRISSVSA